MNQTLHGILVTIWNLFFFVLKIKFACGNVVKQTYCQLKILLTHLLVTLYFILVNYTLTNVYIHTQLCELNGFVNILCSRCELFCLLYNHVINKVCVFCWLGCGLHLFYFLFFYLYFKIDVCVCVNGLYFNDLIFVVVVVLLSSWFSSFLVFQLQQKQIPPPYRPRLESELDLDNFDPQFTLEPVQLTPDDE